MKILVVADVHSNWPALEAVLERETFEACLFVGDLVDYLTDPVPCVNWLTSKVDYAVRGNHDHAVAQRILPGSLSGFRKLACITRPYHWKALSTRELKILGRLPVSQTFSLDGRDIHMVHATPKDPMDEYLGPDPEAWKSRLQDLTPDLLIVGHTHQPYLIEVGQTQVLNPGSVGQPRDGNPEASYAVIEHGRIELRRVAYDFRQTLAQMKQVGMPEWAIELTEVTLSTGGNITKAQIAAAGPNEVQEIAATVF